MKSEYTKGEWRLKPAIIGSPHFNIMDSKETSVIAHIPSQLKQFEANAHLIAQAPKLYEALIHLIAITASLKPNDNVRQDDINAVLLEGKQAIASVEGK